MRIRKRRADQFARGFPLARFLRDGGGAHAVEFAIVSPVFILLICVSIELGLVLLTQSNINYAARDASRLIMTGQVQTGAGESLFTNKVCSDVNVLISCPSLQYNVQSGSSFAGLNGTVVANSSGNMTTTGFSPGGPESDVLVQVGYSFPCIIPIACNYIGTNGKLLLVSTVAFQNENYGGGDSGSGSGSGGSGSGSGGSGSGGGGSGGGGGGF
jgi:Flp pilus assembly protein TadG